MWRPALAGPRLYHYAFEAMGRRRFTRWPSLSEPLKMDATGMNPNNWCRATAASPADAMQPHWLQSGAPPNWHGVIRVSKSADTHRVVLANTHSSGDSG